MIRSLSGFIRRTNNMRLKSKLMLSFILVVFIPVLIVGIFLTAQYRANVLKQATQQTMNNVDKIKSRTSDILRMPIEISNNLLIDKRLIRIVSTNYESTFDVVKAFWDYEDFKINTHNYKEIHNIRFYTTNPTILNNWEFLQPDQTVKDSFWYKEAMDIRKEAINWYYVKDETKGNQPYLSLIRRIDFTGYGASGILVIDVDQDELNSIVRQEPFDTMIFDERGYIITAKNPEWIGLNISDVDFAKELQEKPTGIYDMLYEGKNSKVVIDELKPENSRNGFKIVSVFTIESITGEAERISKLGFTIIIVSLVLAVVLIYITSSFLTRRLLLLNKVLNKVAMGDLNVISHVEGNDEIGLLSRQFNNMVVSIRGLMDEVAESHEMKSQMELRQREIKLKMMASQINPHFLFNALESIRMKAHVKGEKEISNIVKLLGKLMRRSIEIGGRKIQMKEELEIVRYYLEIQKFRYGDDRLTFELDMDEYGQHVEIPPLIVQPLVENAVVHGLEDVESGGFVRVVTKLKKDSLYVEVSDNGVGITPEKKRDIQLALQDMEEGEGYRIGLRNVHQRLVLSYGDSVGLKIESEPGSGTKVSFELPIGGD